MGNSWKRPYLHVKGKRGRFYQKYGNSVLRGKIKRILKKIDFEENVVLPIMKEIINPYDVIDYKLTVEYGKSWIKSYFNKAKSKIKK